MNYVELKKYIEQNIEVSKKIYICNFLSCNKEKMKNIQISLVKNIFGRFVVTKRLDYEYGRYSDRKVFIDKNVASNYAWKLFEELKN